MAPTDTPLRAAKGAEKVLQKVGFWRAYPRPTSWKHYWRFAGEQKTFALSGYPGISFEGAACW